MTLPGDARSALFGRYAKSSSELPIDTAIPLVRDPDWEQQERAHNAAPSKLADKLLSRRGSTAWLFTACSRS